MVEFILKNLILHSRIENDEIEIYRYGLRRLINSVMNVLLILAIGLIYENLFGTIVYTFSYILLRRYSGGYHSKTLVNCYILSTITIVFALNAISYIKEVKINTFIITFVSSVVILVLSPVECRNKKLDVCEKGVYKKRAIVTTLFMYIAYQLLYFINYYISIHFSVSLVIVAFLMVLGKLDNHINVSGY